MTTYIEQRVDALIRQLKEGDNIAQRHAASGLKDIGGPAVKAVPALFDAYFSKDESVSKWAQQYTLCQEESKQLEQPGAAKLKIGNSSLYLRFI